MMTRPFGGALRHVRGWLTLVGDVLTFTAHVVRLPRGSPVNMFPWPNAEPGAAPPPVDTAGWRTVTARRPLAEGRTVELALPPEYTDRSAPYVGVPPVGPGWTEGVGAWGTGPRRAAWPTGRVVTLSLGPEGRYWTVGTHGLH